MLHFQQDKNLEMIRTTDRHFDDLDIPWESATLDIANHLLKLEKAGSILITRHNRVDRTVESKKLPHFRKFTEPFFTDYFENYVERQNSVYDELLVTVRKMLKVNMQNSSSRKQLTQNKDHYWLTCVDVQKEKLRWNKYSYSINIRVFEFVRQKNVAMQEIEVPEVPSEINSDGDMLIEVSSEEEQDENV